MIYKTLVRITKSEWECLYEFIPVTEATKCRTHVARKGTDGIYYLSCVRIKGTIHWVLINVSPEEFSKRGGIDLACPDGDYQSALTAFINHKDFDKVYEMYSLKDATKAVLRDEL
ncbi:MAG: hypothetical protein KAR40_06260 [Candidatus Sabulitectum sp.]|nr:hypothetical protein [Candidatus Sabulitectum sp.]